MDTCKYPGVCFISTTFYQAWGLVHEYLYLSTFKYTFDST